MFPDEATAGIEQARSGMVRLPLTPKGALHLVAKVYGFTDEEIAGPSRMKTIGLARKTIAAILRVMFNLSYKEITYLLGRDNHTTAEWYVKTVVMDDMFWKALEAVAKIMGVDHGNARSAFIRSEQGG